ncbi:YveK family protein [Microbacterium deminutum]|uniref:Polysaccharide chain length determinant N-terminal domain-containing protein n=1 Tax=Microbacterium deminutum TaxID=344164 RepID=A0ABP5BGK9_9MICO
MNLVALGRTFRRNWIWVVLIMLVALAGGWFVTGIMPTQYQATSRVLYALNSQGPLQNQIQATNLAIQRAATDAQLVPTPTVLTPALKKVGDKSLTLKTVTDGVTAVAQQTLLDITVTVDDPKDAAALNSAIIDVLRSSAEKAQIIANPLDPKSAVYTFELTTVTPPVVPDVPFSPSPLINGLIAFAVGALAAAIFLAVRMRGDNRIYDLDTLRAATDHPIIGSLAIRSGRRRGSPRAQDTATLRAALQARAPEGATWLVTSAGDVRSEGVGRSLASSMAAIGQRTTLLATAATPDGAPGITDYLAGTATADDVVDTSRVPGVAYVGPGTMDSRADVFAGAQSPERLGDLTKESDIVFVTAAPANERADAAILGRLGMLTLVLVRKGRTTSTQLARGLAALTEAGADVAGVVWTRRAD